MRQSLVSLATPFPKSLGAWSLPKKALGRKSQHPSKWVCFVRLNCLSCGRSQEIVAICDLRFARRTTASPWIHEHTHTDTQTLAHSCTHTHSQKKTHWTNERGRKALYVEHNLSKGEEELLIRWWYNFFFFSILDVKYFYVMAPRTSQERLLSIRRQLSHGPG